MTRQLITDGADQTRIEKGSLQPSMEDEAQWKFLPRVLVFDGTQN